MGETLQNLLLLNNEGGIVVVSKVVSAVYGITRSDECCNVHYV